MATLDDKGHGRNAERLLSLAVSRFPRDFQLRRKFAERAMMQERWAEALSRWRGPYKDFDYPIGTIGMSQCLCKLGLHLEAEKLVSNLAMRLPGNQLLQAELERINKISKEAKNAAIYTERASKALYGVDPKNGRITL